MAIAVVLPACAGDASDGASNQPPLIVASRGPLRVSVREGGTLEAGRSVVMRSRVEGRNAIIALVPEGTYVTEGQVVCELDSGELADEVRQQETAVDKALSVNAQARGDLAIQEKLNQESLKTAETTLELAERGYQAYRDGALPLERKRLESGLTVAREELKRAQTEFQASERLFSREIIPKTHLEADELGQKKAVERVIIAEKNLAHFNAFTSNDELQKLQSAFEVAAIAHTRVLQQCSSEMAQVRDRHETAGKNLKIEQEQFNKLKAMLADCTIEAEASGLIVYARRRGWDKEEPIKLGRRVYERERLLLIPDLESMEVEFNIHESSVKRVAEGQQVWITVDALPGERFGGSVNRVALVPSSKSSWMNPDLKVYEADVKFNHMVDGVRPGMHAQVEILVADYENELLVPVECVFQSGSRSFVYMETGGDASLREIQVGANNQQLVQVVSGLEEGDRIYLFAPDGAPPVPGPEPRPFLPPSDVATENGG